MSEKEFIQWLIDALLDDDCTDGAVCELACRKLCKMGLITKDDEFWIKKQEDEMISIKTVAMHQKNCPNGVVCKVNDKIKDVCQHGGIKEICQECWEKEIRRWKDE